jgi:hypothetical protein
MHKQCPAEVQLLDLIKLVCYCIVDSETGKHTLLVFSK